MANLLDSMVETFDDESLKSREELSDQNDSDELGIEISKPRGVAYRAVEASMTGSRDSRVEAIDVELL